MSNVTTDEMGFFQFFDIESGLYFELPELRLKYQDEVWVNDVFNPTFYANIKTVTKFNLTSPQELTFELYPRTSLVIICTNISPAAETDIIKFTINNMYKTGGLIDNGI